MTAALVEIIAHTSVAFRTDVVKRQLAIRPHDPYFRDFVLVVGIPTKFHVNKAAACTFSHVNPVPSSLVIMGKVNVGQPFAPICTVLQCQPAESVINAD